MVTRTGSDGAQLTAGKTNISLPSTERARRRFFEWPLLLLLVGVIVVALLDKARDLQSSAELGAFRYSLGALRVGLALDQMRERIGPPRPSGMEPNPFLLLAQPPIGYIGERSATDAAAAAVAPGAWFFDRRCPCVGYRLRDERRFLAASGGSVMLFSLVSPGILVARENYVWRGQAID